MSRLDTLWYTRCGVPTPTGIAVQLGWLEQEFAGDGINIGSVREGASKDIRQSHFDHKLANSFRQGGSIPAIWARASGRETRLLGLTWTDEAQVILSSADSNVRSVRDLKGRRLGIATRPDDVIDFWKATTLRTYLLALESVGLSERDVEFVELPRHGNSFDDPGRATQRPDLEHTVEVQALRSGQVDVVFHKGARGLELASHLRGHTVFDTWANPEVRQRANNHSPRTLTVDRELLECHPRVVVRLVARIVEAGQWASRHSNEAIRLIARETNSTEHWVREAYGRDIHQNLRTDLNESSILAISDFTDFLWQRGFLPAPVDVRAWIDAEPLALAQRTLREADRTTEPARPSL